MHKPASFFDSHSHPHFNAFKDDSDEVIRTALVEGVEMLLVGTQIDTSKKSVAKAEQFKEGVWAAIGLHPIHVTEGYFDPQEEGGPPPPGGAFQRRAEAFDAAVYRELAESSKKVVAIGEIGLDYYRLEGTEAEREQIKHQQNKAFRQQLALAAELDLPVAIHCREAHGDVFALLKEMQSQYPNIRGVIHCFTGTPAEAERYLPLGFLISWSGIVTFAHDWDDFIRAMPLDKMLVETDCPYLTPVPHRGKRNVPQYVQHTVQRIAELRGESVERVATATRDNARLLFGLAT